jgi:hypothetical protein
MLQMATILMDICFDCFDYEIFDVMWNIKISPVYCSNTLHVNIYILMLNFSANAVTSSL